MTRIKLETILVPPTSNNFSDEELAAHVRHYYPNLAGPLKELLNRFSGKAAYAAAAVESEALEETSITCPHCGSEIQIELLDDDE